MPGILDKVTFDLEPSLTYPQRMLEWIPGDVRGEGHAIITLVKGRRAGCLSERDLYQVVETPAGPGFIGREFLWLNRGDVEQPDVYKVLLTPHGHTTCTCKAGVCRAPCCKHADSIKLLVKEGEI